MKFLILYPSKNHSSLNDLFLKKIKSINKNKFLLPENDMNMLFTSSIHILAVI